MMHYSKRQLTFVLLMACLCLQSITVFATEQKAPKERTPPPVFVNQILKPYVLIKKITSEEYVLDAKSEEDAELNAFRQLQDIAASIGADGLIEVKRYVIKDNIATRPAIVVNSSMLKDNIDATAEVLDELTLDSYARGKGTLSTSLFDNTFERSKLSEKIIRFTGKAIKFN